MGKDIDIPLEQLASMNTSLKNIVDEFDHASARSDALESAIGSPHGHGELRHEADRFEGDWNDKRDTLKDKLQKAQERVADFVKAWKDFDLEAAKKLDTSANPPQVSKKQKGPQ
ncbi:hypothetical protein [Microbacterium xylanilyticum]